MEFKSQELQKATEVPSSITSLPKDTTTKSVINNELRKYFYMQPGKSNTYFELGALYATKDINPIESIITAIQQYYLQLAKDRDEHVEFVSAMFTAINANVKLIQQVDEKLNIANHTESTALIGGVFKITMNVSIKSRNGNEHIMSVETYTRWLCLIEGLNVITQAGEKANIDFERDNSWIKPIALQNYVTERYPAMLHDVCVEENIDLTPTPEFVVSIPLKI